MEKLQKILPGFVEEMKDALTELGRTDLVGMLDILTLNRMTYDEQADALYLYVCGTRELNVVEKNIIGVKYDGSIELRKCSGIVVLDIDNYGRISGIEIIGRKDVYNELKTHTNLT